jgi:hypothetical protein
MAERNRGDNQNAGEQRPSDRKGGQGGERAPQKDRGNERPSNGQAGHQAQVDQRGSAVDRKPGDAGRQSDSGGAGSRDLAGEERTNRRGNQPQRADEPAEEGSRIRSSDEDRG